MADHRVADYAVAERSTVKRCAIYTRKSSEEGLDQDFNSLDAQRPACEAYIKSQAGEGWRLIRTAYDDGGFSGGTMNRPALVQLLADITDRKLDIVIVYKVDRLTRSLTDFSRLAEQMDEHGVSFVSVTQSFNTTTSMGRLTLNMLLSFAQFEREVTGERIRDKIAASKRKGLWMGGHVPLGYEADGRTLKINKREAETVCAIFRLYLEHGSVRQLKVEAERLGLTTKVRKTSKGTAAGGKPFSRGHLYRILNNPLYIGMIAHKGEVHEGQHEAIIDRKTWDAVRARLAANTHERRTANRLTESGLLTGKLFDEGGRSLTPHHASKAGRRYRYYVSRHLLVGTDGASDQRGTTGWRLPAPEIERTVATAVEALLSDQAVLASTSRDAGLAVDQVPALLDAATAWQGNPIGLVRRVDLRSDQITLTLILSPILDGQEYEIRHIVPIRLKRRGVERRIVLGGNGRSETHASYDQTLIKAIARAHAWFDDLASGKAGSIKAIAQAECVTDRYIGQHLPLAFLAPDIVEAILAGIQPPDLTADRLIKQVDLPLKWADQRTLLGFTS